MLFDPTVVPGDVNSWAAFVVGNDDSEIPANFCDILFDEDFNGTEITGRSFRFEMVPFGAPSVQTPVWIGNKLQDTTRSLTVTTVVGTEKVRCATNIEGGYWRVTTAAGAQYRIKPLSPYSGTTVQLKQVLDV